jgi:small-conductance mechanosensitive channel
MYLLEPILRDLLDFVGSIFAPDRIIHLVKVIFMIVIILLLTRFANRVVGKIFRGLFTPKKDDPRYAQRAKWAKTAIPLMENVSKWLIMILSLFFILSAIGVPLKALLASAGVAGLAIGFGARNLIADVIAGFFLMFEGLVRVGDYIKVGKVRGRIVSVGLRVIQVRRYNGQLWVIPNGKLENFANYSREYTRAIVKVGVPYEQDVRKALKILKEVGQQWYEDHQDIALDKPTVTGIITFDQSSCVIRIACKVKALKHWRAQRQIRLLIRDAFEREGIEIPFNRSVVYFKNIEGVRGEKNLYSFVQSEMEEVEEEEGILAEEGPGAQPERQL